MALLDAEAARGDGGRSDPQAARHAGRERVVRNRVFVHGDAYGAKRLFRVLPRPSDRAEIDEHQVVVRAAGDDAQPLALQRRRHGAGVLDDLPPVGVELGAERLAEADGFGGDGVHKRPALRVGKDGAVDGAAPLLVAQDERAARPAQRLVRRARHHCGVGQGRRVRSGGDEPGDMGHIHHQRRADLLRDFGEPREVYGARVGREARDDDLRHALPRLLRDGVVVERLRLRV